MRIFLLVLTNLAVMLVLALVTSMLGVNHWLNARGISMAPLFIYCGVFGMGGAAISLLLSKPIAKWTTGARVITGREGPVEQDLVQIVSELAARARIGCPEVAIYDGAPNAFATGAFRNSALVAVSTGLLHTMDREQVYAVLAHEVSHIANGDMQTMTLLQGVLNTFVMFAARVVGRVVDKAVFKNDSERPGLGFVLAQTVLQLVFGLVASIIVMAYSRRREYRADWGAAELMGNPIPMKRALKGLAGEQADLPRPMAAFGISGSNGGFLDLLRSHPSLDARIQALEKFGR
jgi:heat shock protein HtpX